MDIFQVSGDYRTYNSEKGKVKSKILNMEEIHWKILSLMVEKYENIYL
ncbi:Mobile element protein [Methanosarcina barkeri MS]|uniref:Mobile element protein n=1 Tax=Methanosarcina barkeri MS TaxID=1434108 RepID=A0A0E3QYJ6_METBA|nr:Mobile element protein [Methanosarcina barkeri MS]